MSKKNFLLVCLSLQFLSLILRLILPFNFSGCSAEKAKAAERAAGKRPQVELPPAPEDLRDSGSSKLKIKDATGKSQPDPFHSENVSTLISTHTPFASVGN